MSNPTLLSEAGQSPACSADAAIISPAPGNVSTPSATETAAAQGAATPVTVTQVPVTSAEEEVEVPDVPQLNYRQRKALALLLMGRSTVAISAEIGISRSTLRLWRLNNPHFIAFANAWREQSQQTVADNVQATTEHASHVVLEAVKKGDLRASLAVLKATGALSLKKPGATTPLDVARGQKCREHRNENRQLQARIRARRKTRYLESDALAYACAMEDDQLEAELEGRPAPEPDPDAKSKAILARYGIKVQADNPPKTDPTPVAPK